MPSATFVLLAALFVALCLAGGASKPDVMGQVLVRTAAWVALVALTLLGARRPQRRAPVVLAILLASLALVLLQLVPLPPAWWHALPGRQAFAPAEALAGSAGWRPIAIVPSDAINAVGSLVVPFAVYTLIVRCDLRADRALVALLLGTVAAMMLMGLLQFAGVPLRNPFVNGGDAVDGLFANRNHFALFLALGCPLALVWGFAGRDRAGWQAPAALGLLLLLTLVILASGSRSGIVLGVVAITIGGILVGSDVRRTLKHYPKRVRYLLMVGVGLSLVGMIALSIFVGRAVSVDRALSLDLAQDMRSRALPVVMAMVRDYFPVGSGIGGFDAVFRAHEPFALLKPTYFNRAHNDFLEIVLDAGLTGLVILLGAIGWWAWATARVWRREGTASVILPRLGSAMILLVMLASLFDYPARTPLIMAVLVVAAIWLDGGTRQVVLDKAAATLPSRG